MTENEKNDIVNQVLEVIRSGCRTIEQLTPVDDINDSDKFEISGGRSINYLSLAEKISSLSQEQFSDVLTTVNSRLLKLEQDTITSETIIAQLRLNIDSLGYELTDTIGSLEERIDALTDSIGEDGGIAPLDSEGRVPIDCLPEGADEIVTEVGAATDGQGNVVGIEYEKQGNRRYAVNIPNATAEHNGWMSAADKRAVADLSARVSELEETAPTAGMGSVLNVNELCGGDIYTIETAIAAILTSASDCVTSGLVITYKTGENTWETKQYRGEADDFAEVGLWQDFGSGSTNVVTSEEPQEGGTEALSTGGAYRHIPTQITVDTETQGVVKLSLANEAGEQIGEEAQFAVGSGGGGGGSATIVSIYTDTSHLYDKAGGTMILRAAIQSVTMVGASERLNDIERVELYDRDTQQLLRSYQLDRASSESPRDYDFEFDLSTYFAVAGSRRFTLIAYDNADNTGSRNIRVTGVDVTVRTAQTLNYTASTAIVVGGGAKSLPMYRFPNNASDKGIQCTTEINIGGEWRLLGTATVTDTYAHSITINPSNCCGTTLGHGAYPLRIHGEDIASGVVGNYLHTAVMVVGASTEPILVTRWLSEEQDAIVKLYESVSIDFAAYDPSGNAQVSVDIVEVSGGEQTVKQTVLAHRSSTYHYTQYVVGYDTDGSATFGIKAKFGAYESQEASFRVLGTVLDIEPVTAQLIFDMDMSGRSNSDADKTIMDGGHTLTVVGSNYTTNGFVKDSFGTEQYGTVEDKGEMSLRIAENVTGELDYAPFFNGAVETNGMSLQMRIRTKHMAEEDGRLISCIKDGIGFYVTSNRVVLTFDGESTVARTIDATLPEDTVTDVAIVIEPTAVAPFGGIGVARLYFDGELIGACYYNQGSLTRHDVPISFDGTGGDLYLYNIRAWETHYTFEQAFDNYLLKIPDNGRMIEEYDFNRVMASQSAEGQGATSRPQMSALGERGIPYAVMCKSPDTEDTAENYPDYIEGLDGDKKTPTVEDWYFYFPDTPWRNIVIEGVPTTNQGTTSSMRPIKNKKGKTKKCKRIRMMYDRSTFTDPAQLAEYDLCAGLAASKKFQILAGTMPTNIFCIKVDYSESGGANNGASCQLNNELSRALGNDYMTPAQNYYSGDYELNPSISSLPIALFRTDASSPDATSPSYGYFHAKGNLNHDKGDAGVFGFEDVPGYNDGCLNYGDFIELVAARGQSLDDFAESIDKSQWERYTYKKNDDGTIKVDGGGNPVVDHENVYVLSEFCGPGHKVYRWSGGSWVETTGTMLYEDGRWKVEGDFVNPVECYELKAYNDMDWFQNVSTIDDMLRREDGKLVWLQQYESRYPDDDDLNQAYEDGRKLPYRLYKWLQWCNECNQHKGAADGDITIDGVSVSGTAENRLRKFERELHKEANPYSAIYYHVFTDYLAAVDQRSKNMMVGFYLETDQSVRMYLNHLYDGDTILGSDNDCGLTIPATLDPNNDPTGMYQGHDSVLFTQLARASHIWLRPYQSESDTEDATRTTTVAAITARMRSQQLPSGLRPFSPQGIEKYWITDRLSKWPKLVSSYDGERKYIKASKSSANYFFALHGLSIQRLREYVKERFLIRDGYYGCGDTYSSAVQMRCTGTDMSVTIKAARAGYFGLGVDRANEANGGSCFLNEGEEHTFYSHNTNLASGVMLYVFGADRIGELDIRNATPKQQGWDISKLTLLRKLIIGGTGYVPATNNGGELSSLSLGQLPFLESVDVRNFPVMSIDASYCPRLVEVLAAGSSLQTITLAQTSPISTLELPSAMTSLRLNNLPNLAYPSDASGKGLIIDDMSAIKALELSRCARIDSIQLLSDIIDSGATLTALSIADVNVTADSSMLTALMDMGAKGVGSDLAYGCDGLTGRWLLSTFYEDVVVNQLSAYFPGLSIYNSQYTMIEFDDTVSDPRNIRNLDNNTTGSGYVASGHLLNIRRGLVPVCGKYNGTSAKWEGFRVSDLNYRKKYDGSDYDYSDTGSTGNDVMMRCPHFWYKGINDFKNQKKYICWSSVQNVPLSTSETLRRYELQDVMYRSDTVLYANRASVGSGIEGNNVLAANAQYDVYRVSVAGMRQVRWPGVNDSQIGGVFVDAYGGVVQAFRLNVTGDMMDFINGEDYVFTTVPSNADAFLFAAPKNAKDTAVIVTDSSEIEAIEPDWVENRPWLCGVYQSGIDSSGRLRSLSGLVTRKGTDRTGTASWTYDANGRPTNSPTITNYTIKDLLNLAARRGPGYQAIDFEMHKILALLWYSLNGTRNEQPVLGNGHTSVSTQTGSQDLVGNADTTFASASGGIKCLGLENLYGVCKEVVDNVAVNVPDYHTLLLDGGVAQATYPTDGVWHIYDPISGTERTVQGIIGTQSLNCIARMRHGRYCDMVPSKCISDTSSYATHYACGYGGISSTKGGFVNRADKIAMARGGLAYLATGLLHGISDSAQTTRLAYRGEIEINE